MNNRGRTRGSPLALEAVTLQANKNRADLRATVIAAMTCDIVLSAVKQGIFNAIITIRGRPKTKYQYNQERKRDFRVGKSAPKVKTKYDMLKTEDQESGTKIVYSMLETDPSRFIRDYKAPVFEDAMRFIHPSFKSFATLERMDLSHQRLGDGRCEQLCKAINKSPIVYLNFSGNDLTDAGLRHLAVIQRSLHNLACLNLSWNLFTDDGFIMLCDREKYHSPSLTQLDITYNAVSPLAAYHLGALFEPGTHSDLKHIRLGGIVSRGSKANWGDDFIKQFFGPILKSTQLSRLKVLHLSDCALTDVGVEVVLGWLLCDECRAIELNLSKTLFSPRIIKQLLPCVLSMSAARDCNMILMDCGLTILQIKDMQDTLSSDRRHETFRKYMTTRQLLDTIRVTQQALHNAVLVRYYLTQQLLNTWKLETPVRWMDVPPAITGSFTMPLLRGNRGHVPSTTGIVKYVKDKRELQEKVISEMLLQLSSQAGYVHMLQQVLSVMDRQPKPDLPRLTISLNENLSLLVQEVLSVHQQSEKLARWHEEHMRKWTQAVDDAMGKGREFLTNLYGNDSDNNHNSGGGMSTKAPALSSKTLPSITTTASTGSIKKVATKKKTVLTEEEKVTEEALMMLLEEAWVWTKQQGEHDSRWIGLRHRLRTLHFIFIQLSSSAPGMMSTGSKAKAAMRRQPSSSLYSQSSSVAGDQKKAMMWEADDADDDYKILVRKMVPCSEAVGDLAFFMYYLCTVYPKEKDATD